MKGFIRSAVTLAASIVCVGLLAIADCSAQQCNANSNQVSSAAAIQNQAVIDQLSRLQAQVNSTPRVSSATVSAPAGSVAQRRALSAPATTVAAAAPASTVSAVATSSGTQDRPRRGIRGIVDRNRASSVAISGPRRNIAVSR